MGRTCHLRSYSKSSTVKVPSLTVPQSGSDGFLLSSLLPVLFWKSSLPPVQNLYFPSWFHWDSPVSCSPVYLNPPSLWFPFFVWFFSPFLSMTLSVKEDGVSMSRMTFIGGDTGSGRWIPINVREREAILASMISWRSTQTQTMCDTLLTPNEVTLFGLRFGLLYLYLESGFHHKNESSGDQTQPDVIWLAADV